MAQSTRNLAKARGLRIPTRRPLKWGVRIRPENEDGLFTYHFNQLLVDVLDICHEFFGIAHFHERRSPWARGFPDEFCQYVEAIAYPDALGGKWDGILREGAQREMLVCGIIWKVLDAQVFSELLFGADQSYAEWLKSVDTMLVDVEGFQRAQLRAHVNSTYLDSVHEEPPLFWATVDRVATQLLALLHPLYQLVGEKRLRDIPPLEELYQRLHDTVAHAGYLSVQVRLSAAVTGYEWPQPGDTMRHGHESACERTFEASKARAAEYDGKFVAKPMPWTRAPRCKIAMVPQVTRHAPGATDPRLDPQKTVYRVMRAKGVYYKGWRDAQTERDGFVTLVEHVRLAKMRPKMHPPVAVVLALLVSVTCAALAIWPNFRGEIRRYLGA